MWACVWVDEEMPGGKVFLFFSFFPPPPQIQSVIEEICFFLNGRPLCCFAALPLIAILQPATGRWTEVFLITLSGEAGLASASF